MTSHALSAAAQPPASRVIAWIKRILTAHPLATVLIFTLILTAINPIGFLGGDGDEYQYLKAARCAADHGFCLPHDHWWRRYPIVAPAGLALRLLGESQMSVAIVPLLYGLAAIALFVLLVERQFGRVEAVVAGLVLTATPVFSESMLQLGIDMPEFAFTLAALLFLQTADRRGGNGWVIASGLMLGLAIQARPTSLALVPIAIGLVLILKRRDWLMPLMAGCLLPNLVEAVAYWLAAGDPLLPWKLSLAHTTVPSTELLPGVDTRQSPLFNPAFIGGWRRPMGINVHWTVDGLLNLVNHPAIAATITCALMLVLLDRRNLGKPSAGGRTLILLMIGAALWFGALTYGFAIDPKPRMFFIVAAVASACFGVLAHSRWPESRLLIGAAMALILVKGLVVSYERLGLRPEAALAPAWIAAEGDGLAIDPRTARFLPLVPEVKRLPLFNEAGPYRRMLIIGQATCPDTAAYAGYFGWRTERAAAFPLSESAAITFLRRHRFFFSPAIVPVMCIMRRG